MVLQPSRRDNDDPKSTLRHHQSYLRGIDPGFLDGGFATPQLVPPGQSQLVGGDEGGGDDADADILGEDGDRLVLTNLATQVWRLAYDPVSETLVVRWHPDGGAGVEWKRGELYDLAEDDNVVTIPASSLAAEKAEVRDTFSAQYLRVEGEIGGEDFTIPFGSSGWSYLALPGSPDSDPDDHSTDDPGAWPVGAAPIGDIAGDTGWLALATHVTAELLWIQRTVPGAENMTITVRVEDNCKVYVNGTLVGTVPEFGSGYPPETEFTVPADVLKVDANVVSVRVNNETPPIQPDVYVDVSIEGGGE